MSYAFKNQNFAGPKTFVSPNFIENVEKVSKL